MTVQLKRGSPCLHDANGCYEVKVRGQPLRMSTRLRFFTSQTLARTRLLMTASSPRAGSPPAKRVKLANGDEAASSKPARGGGKFGGGRGRGRGKAPKKAVKPGGAEETGNFDVRALLGDERVDQLLADESSHKRAEDKLGFSRDGKTVQLEIQRLSAHGEIAPRAPRESSS